MVGNIARVGSRPVHPLPIVAAARSADLCRRSCWADTACVTLLSIVKLSEITYCATVVLLWR